MEPQFTLPGSTSLQTRFLVPFLTKLDADIYIRILNLVYIARHSIALYS